MMSLCALHGKFDALKSRLDECFTDVQGTTHDGADQREASPQNQGKHDGKEEATGDNN